MEVWNMNDLHDFGIRGRLAYFISAFLNESQFRVRVGNTFSKPHEQEMGVPPGKHSLCFTVQCQNQQYCEVCLPWRGMLFVC